MKQLLSSTSSSEEEKGRESVALVRELKSKLFWNKVRRDFREGPISTVFWPILVLLFTLLCLSTLSLIDHLGGLDLSFMLVVFYCLICLPFLFSFHGSRAYQFFWGFLREGDNWFRLSPLALRPLYLESFKTYLRYLVVIGMGVFLLLHVLVQTEWLNYQALLLYLLLWLNAQLLQQSWLEARFMWGLLPEQEAEPEIKNLGRCVIALNLTFPILALFGLGSVVPLLALVLLIPLDIKAYKLWQDYILPNCGRHDVWFSSRYGELDVPAEEIDDPQENGIFEEGQEKTRTRESMLTGNGLGWEVVEELLGMDLQYCKTSGFLNKRPLLVMITLFLFVVALLAFDQHFFFVYLVFTILVLSSFLLAFGNILSHPIIDAATPRAGEPDSIASDWFHLIPVPGSLVISNTLGFSGRLVMQTTILPLVLILGLLLQGRISEVWMFTQMLVVLMAFYLLALNTLLDYREPSPRRSAT